MQRVLMLAAALVLSLFQVTASDDAVQEFQSFTADLIAIADWLYEYRIDTVAMASTGVYWIALFELLESRRFKVFLVYA